MGMIRFNSIVNNSVVDGPGTRTVLFVQGCSLACIGCQSRALWPSAGGQLSNIKDLAETLCLLSAKTKKITLSGGEIFQQPAAILELVQEIEKLGEREIIAYSGYTWEELHNPSHPANAFLDQILSRLAILVDGRFDQNQDDDYIQYRGSRNQRVIDIPASLAAGEPIFLSWDDPEITIDDEGNLILSKGLAEELGELGTIEAFPMCGQVKRDIRPISNRRYRLSSF